MVENYDGIKFYSSTDLSSGYFLKGVEDFFHAFDPEKEYTQVNNVIELFNIKCFFDIDLRLTKWSDTDFDCYKKITENFAPIIAQFFSKINEMNFMKHLQDVDINYIDDFWFLFNHYKVYECISDDIFSQAFVEPNIRHILHQKNLVNYYGKILANYLVAYPSAAVLLLNEFLVADRVPNSPLYFPKELTGEQKEDVIIKYIQSEQANPNYLDLISRSQYLADLPIQDKTKLEARKKYEEYVSEFFWKVMALPLAPKLFFRVHKEKRLFLMILINIFYHFHTAPNGSKKIKIIQLY